MVDKETRCHRVKSPAGPTPQLWSAKGLSNMVMDEFMHHPVTEGTVYIMYI